MGWLRQQWNDIKGNVKFAVLVFLGTSGVTGAIALTHGLLLWQQAALAACFVFLFGWAALFTALHYSRSRQPTLASGPDDTAASVEEVLRNAPSLLVRQEPQPLRADKLTFKSDRGTAIIQRLSRLMSRELYEAQYELTVIPASLPPVDNNWSVSCEVFASNSLTSQGSRLPDILSKGTPDTVDAVVIDYEDSDGKEFSRCFTLTRNNDGSVTWTPGRVASKGEAAIPAPVAQSGTALRQKLTLANAYHNEHAAAQQYAKQLEEEKEARRLAESRLSRNDAIWPKASVIYSVAGAAKRLRSRLLNMLTVAQIPLNQEFAELLKTPLSSVAFDSEPRQYTVEKWRFQEDFKELRARVMEIDAQIEISACVVPDQRSADEVQGMLFRTARDLDNYAASLFNEHTQSA